MCMAEYLHSVDFGYMASREIKLKVGTYSFYIAQGK